MKPSLLMVLAALATPSAARADDTGATAVFTYGVLGVAAAIFDIGFTAYDVSHFVSGEPASRRAGLFETVGALPQAIIAGYVLANPPPADGVRALSLAWLVWASALTAHGVWTVARPEEPSNRIEIGVRRFQEHPAGGLPVVWTANGRF